MRFIRVEDARRELCDYRGEHVRNKLRGTPSGAVAEDLDPVYEGDFHYGEWVMPNLESTQQVLLSTVFGNFMNVFFVFQGLADKLGWKVYKFY